MKHIDWEKLQSYSPDVFKQFEGKIEESIQKELEERARKIEEKKKKRKKKKKK